MVTTIGDSSREVLALFEGVTAKVKEAVANTDKLESEVRELAFQTLVSAIETVVPALKLVDKYVDLFGGGQIRGIELPDPKGGSMAASFVLSREGAIYHFVRGKGSLPIRLWIEGEKRNLDTLIKGANLDTPEYVQAILNILDRLRIIFREAMEKNEARHTKMGELRDRLGAAVAVLNVEKSADQPA